MLREQSHQIGSFVQTLRLWSWRTLLRCSYAQLWLIIAFAKELLLLALSLFTNPPPLTVSVSVSVSVSVCVRNDTESAPTQHSVERARHHLWTICAARAPDCWEAARSCLHPVRSLLCRTMCAAVQQCLPTRHTPHARTAQRVHSGVSPPSTAKRCACSGAMCVCVCVSLSLSLCLSLSLSLFLQETRPPSRRSAHTSYSA